MSFYLITGASGFVGQETVRQVLAAGDSVVAIGRRRPPGNVEFIHADLRDKDLAEKLNGRTFDYILHIAALPGDSGNPYEMLEVNANGTLAVLEYGRSLGGSLRQVVVASSISAYEWYPATKFSAPDYLPVDEEHPCRPRDMYSTTKRIQELLAITYFEQYHVPAACLRLTAIIGPDGQGGGRGWRDIASQMKNGETIRIPHFSETELCHYVDIRDVARMMICAAQNPNASGQIFNCCGPRAITGAEFAAIIEKHYPGAKVEFNFPWSMAQGGRISFSMDKAKKLLDFEPKYSVEDSVISIKHWIDGGGLGTGEERRDSYTNGVRKE